MSDKYTYQQYCDIWMAHFGDDEIGEFGYYHYGKHRTKSLPKMTEQQFGDALAEFEKLAAQIEEMLRQKDYDNSQLKNLFNQSLKYELPLFF